MSERARAAAAVRDLGHLLVGRQVSDDVLTDLADTVRAWGDKLDQLPARRRPEEGLTRDLARPTPADGHEVEHFADCPVSGAVNPFSPPLRAWREGDEVVCRVTLGAAFEGAPGRSHGGVVAALFDDAMGFLVAMLHEPAYAGTLTIRYLRPTPLGEPLQIRARVARREGRRLVTEAELRHRDVLVAESNCVQVVVGADRVGRPAYDY